MNATILRPSPAPVRRRSVAGSLIDRLSGAQSLSLSAMLHTILLLLISALFVKQHNRNEIPDFAAPPGGLVSADPEVQPPPSSPPQLDQPRYSQPTPNVSKVPMAPSQVSALTTNNATVPTFHMSSLATTTPAVKSDRLSLPFTPKVTSTGHGLSKEMASRIASFTSGWSVGGTATVGKPLKSREFVFTAYLAKYQGGDWDSTVRIEDGRIWAGSLPNLLFIITKLSKQKIHAQPQVEPLDLASDEIFVKKPPFIWFTGHRDFTLTDKEVENLGEYLRRGGCIWGDSSLPGRRSRFDIAFRREMLRLVPDPNQAWQALPPSHPIFTHAWYSEIKSVPPGVNYYDEPVYTLMGYGGEIAVIYTANDYGDMWQFGIDEKGEIDLSRDDKRRMVAVNEEMWYRRNLYYRNIDRKALLETYKFGTNVIIHLLTRWEEKLRNVPRSADNMTN